MDSNYLMHHGIIGMKWGVRRYQNADGTLTSLGRSRYGKSGTKALRKEQKSRENAYKYRSLMSDSDLNKRVTRLEKEKRFRELTNSEVNPGRTYVNELLNQYGKQALGVAVGVAATAIAQQYVNEKLKKKS